MIKSIFIYLQSVVSQVHHFLIEVVLKLSLVSYGTSSFLLEAAKILGPPFIMAREHNIVGHVNL